MAESSENNGAEAQSKKKKRLLGFGFPLPDFLTGVVDAERYNRWIWGRTTAHLKRDKIKAAGGNRRRYAEKMHAAVLESRGLDSYTGKEMDWSLIGTYNNEDAARKRRAYRIERRNAPTFDHVADRECEASFKICSQVTNDCKSHLLYEEFIAFCRDIIAHHERLRGGPGNP